MRRFITQSTVGLAVLALSGCSGLYLNEGATRMRFGGPGAAEQSVFQGMFIPPEEKNKRQIINADDPLSIRLISAFICDFHESSLSGITGGELFNSSNAKSSICMGGDGKESSSKRGTRGEIVMIAQAGEMSSSNAMTFDLSKLRDRGRVIYYNPDVRESGQLINAVNIPIYGPQKYTGLPFMLDLSILELDNEENKQIKNLLGKLAAIGASVSAPSNGPVINVLKTLGGALISGNGDDLEMRYQAVFDVAGADGSVVYRMPLSEGYIALVRQEQRDQEPEWGNFCLDATDGLLREKRVAGTVLCNNSKAPVYRKTTWVLVRISKEDKDSPEVLHTEALEAVGTFLERNKDAIRAQPTPEQVKADWDAVKEAFDNLKPKTN